VGDIVRGRRLEFQCFDFKFLMRVSVLWSRILNKKKLIIKLIEIFEINFFIKRNNRFNS
jgi:hypothetical protein